MPIWEDDKTTIADLDKIRRKSKCKVCGTKLNIYIAPDSGKAFIACWDWLRTQHEGIEREASRYEREGLASLNIKTRREIMEKEYGPGMTKALEKYQGAAVITRNVATEIVNTLWGSAPLIEKQKCILLCQTYQLNPLMKHLYLVGYKRKKDGKVVLDSKGNPVIDWSIQIGIGATRLLAQRKHNFSYLDMTPRKASQMEIDKILGDTADPNCIYGFVHIKDVDTGAEAFGLRGIERTASIKGQDKGNTHLNQACVRAERLALDRQYPGEMPQDIETVDERYMEAAYKVVDKATGEVIEGEARELNGGEPSLPPEAAEPPDPIVTPPKEHWCEEHNCSFDKKTGKYGDFYAHKKPEGGWCNEKKKKDNESKPETQASTQPSEVTSPKAPHEPAANTIEALKETAQLCNWGTMDIGQFCNAEKGWNIREFKDLKPDQITEVVDHIKRNPK